MTPIISNDGFDVFMTETGYVMSEKSGGSKKMMVTFLLMGSLFFILSFLPIDEIVSGTLIGLMITFLRWGGLLLIVGTLIASIVQTMTKKETIVTIDTEKSQMEWKGKTIPFTEINSFSCDTPKLLGKTMIAIDFRHNNRRKRLITATAVKDPSHVLNFVQELNSLIQI